MSRTYSLGRDAKMNCERYLLFHALLLLLWVNLVMPVRLRFFQNKLIR